MSEAGWLDTKVRRAALVRMFEAREGLVLVGPRGDAHELHGDSAQLARTVLSLLAVPLTGRELLARLETLTGGPIERPEVIAELLALLRGVEAIGRANASPPRAHRRMTPGPRVLLGLTGAVATMHAPALVQLLQERGFRVRVAATHSALRFVRTEALEALTHEAVVGGIWPTDERLRVPHIELAQWADAVVVYPASATTISRLASGDFGSIVSAIALSTRAPVLVVPSMNEAMLTNPAVSRNLEQLCADGLNVAAPAAGLEVADRPEARTPAVGAAPTPSIVVQLLEAMLRRCEPIRHAPEAADWDAMYRNHVAGTLPWHVEEPDAGVLAAVSRHAPAPASVLEIGTGLGTLAVALARRGHRVVATDISSVALEMAHARAPESGVVWLRDSITESALHGRFEIACDRGCLHGLSEGGRQAYAAAVARLLAPGGALVLQTLALEAAPTPGVTPQTAESVQALFAGFFELVRDEPATLEGPTSASPARLFVLKRRAEET